MTDIKVDPFTSRTNLYNSASVVDFNRLLDFTFLRPAKLIVCLPGAISPLKFIGLTSDLNQTASPRWFLVSTFNCLCTAWPRPTDE